MKTVASIRPELDTLRRALGSVPGLKVRNLNPRGKGHVWPNTPLAELTLHKKGKLK